jgi:hypothetical protein
VGFKGLSYAQQTLKDIATRCRLRPLLVTIGGAVVASCPGSRTAWVCARPFARDRRRSALVGGAKAVARAVADGVRTPAGAGRRSTSTAEAGDRRVRPIHQGQGHAMSSLNDCLSYPARPAARPMACLSLPPADAARYSRLGRGHPMPARVRQVAWICARPWSASQRRSARTGCGSRGG